MNTEELREDKNLIREYKINCLFKIWSRQYCLL